jgi:hypothetical protein
MDDFSRMRIDRDLRTRSLADLIYEVTEPPGGDVPLELLLTKPAPYLVIGLLQGCRNFLLGACALFDADRESAIPPLARSVMEFSVTGIWLLRNPRHNVQRFLRAQLHEAELLSETDAVEAQEGRDGVLDSEGPQIRVGSRSRGVSRSPHLSDEQAAHLIDLVLDRYELENGNSARRVVVQKSSLYRPHEREGFVSRLSERVQRFDLLRWRLDRATFG